jgi:hypothetical protein
VQLLRNVGPRSVCSLLSINPQLTALPVVARIRPLLGAKELDKDVIVRAECSEDGKPMNIVRIPNPKNESEELSFMFNGVYDMGTTQEELFTNEGTIAHCRERPCADSMQLLPTSNLFSKVST